MAEGVRQNEFTRAHVLWRDDVVDVAWPPPSRRAQACRQLEPYAVVSSRQVAGRSGGVRGLTTTAAARLSSAWTQRQIFVRFGVEVPSDCAVAVAEIGRLLERSTRSRGRTET